MFVYIHCMEPPRFTAKLGLEEDIDGSIPAHGLDQDSHGSINA